ncbi:hypothetical protein K6119_00425 [Paracrocinitomix mangrovi]|uniref:hypothetical protein n=1 Tax=Paracrocinitomix mangrovi TaxID=2862509 RepID=UPI001C8DD6C7|nr:hypothetical protein [Paracrocinitomix mangrovi]UKN01979.1 hypothetical protein K6119_00425 [Paracrocinitomix mangrovi]
MINPFLNFYKDDQTQKDAIVLEELVSNLNITYQPAKSSFTDSLKGFELLTHLFNCRVYRNFCFKNGNRQTFYLLEVVAAHRTSKFTVYSIQPSTEEYRIYPFVVFKTSLTIGHVIVRPETISDKITELIKPVEVDFKNHKSFSFKYFVSAADKDLVTSNFPFELMDYLNKQRNISLEFKDGLCLMRHSKAINIKDGVELCKIASDIQQILA